MVRQLFHCLVQQELEFTKCQVTFRIIVAGETGNIVSADRHIPQGIVTAIIIALVLHSNEKEYPKFSDLCDLLSFLPELYKDIGNNFFGCGAHLDNIDSKVDQVEIKMTEEGIEGFFIT